MYKTYSCISRGFQIQIQILESAKWKSVSRLSWAMAIVLEAGQCQVNIDFLSLVQAFKS